jgi:DNA polymerase III epsilon subunit-like protein
MNIIFLDTEATGNDTKTDRLCQVCYKHNGHFFTEYFKPPVPISIKAMSITHITNEMVADSPVFIGSPYAERLQTILNTAVLVAHNAPFDIAILQAEGISVHQYICTLKLSRFLDDKGVIPEYNQQFLRYYLRLSFDVPIVPHDAESDVLVLEGIYQRLATEYKKRFGDEYLNKMIEISMNPLMIKRFTFGKYNGDLIEDIAKTDKGYVQWLLKAKRENSDGEEDWIYTLENYLS